jgi:hypothetical protein
MTIAGASILRSPQQLRQPGGVDRNPPRFIPREQIGSGAPAGLKLIVRVRQRLPPLREQKQLPIRQGIVCGLWAALTLAGSTIAVSCCSAISTP